MENSIVWVIKHMPIGAYLSSTRQLVWNMEFARKFYSRKQAYAYLAKSDFNRKEFTLVEYSQREIPGQDEIISHVMHYLND
ncbi:MAG: hypothetical protein IJX77_10590 [Ruminococcus sp.]|nr:hypothetical protein [Ruminococcus sp.]